jgi:RimJ/RimL family protein N-acetyltransferase
VLRPPEVAAIKELSRAGDGRPLVDVLGAAPIGTERLLLTPLRVQDADEMARVLDDERLHEFTGGSPESPAALRARYERLLAGSPDPAVTWLNWIVRERAGGHAVGTVQATVAVPRRSHPEAGPAIAPADAAAEPRVAEPGTPAPGTPAPAMTETGVPAPAIIQPGAPAPATTQPGAPALGLTEPGKPAATGGVGHDLTAEVAWVIGMGWQGRGYAAEAAAGLVGWLLGHGATVITACIHPDHHRSAGVAARVGLRPTEDMADGERVWRLIVP